MNCKKNSVSKLFSFVFHCFFNFLCISLFFDPFLFIVFLMKFCCWHYFNHKQHKVNSFQPVKIEIINDLWIWSENPICIDFVHEITFLSTFWPDAFFLIMRKFATAYPGAANLVSKVARYLKEKSRGTARRQLFALQIYREKCWGGAESAPPVYIGLSI